MELEEGTEVVGGSLAVPEAPPKAEDKPAEQPPAAAAPVVDDDGEPEGTIEGTQGVKFVPLDAVKAERGKRKEAEKTLKEKDTLIQQLQEKANRFDEASQYLDQAKPIIEQIKANPDLVRLAKNPPKVEEPLGPLSPEEAVEMAKDLDLYKADGSPDTARAQKIAKRQESLAERKAQQYVAPFHQQNAIQQSAHMRNLVLSQKDEQGNAKFDPQAVDAVWKLVSPEESAKPEIANALAIFSLGLMAQKGTLPKQTPAAAPIHTESVGGGGKGAPALTAVGERMQAASGLSKKDYLALRETVTDGPNVLE